MSAVFQSMKLAKVIVLFITPSALYAQPAWDGSLDFQAIEQQLQTETIKDTIPMSVFLKQQRVGTKASSKMRFIEFESGLQAVFKPGYYAYAEIAAYKASNALGLRLVPPTVLRTINGVRGSLQFFIGASIPLSAIQYGNKLFSKDVSDMHVFYFVFGQWDIHGGNQILSKSRGRYWLGLIDNAAILHRQYGIYGKRPFIEKGDERKGLPCVDTPHFPFDAVQTVNTGSKEKMRELFGTIIPDQIARLTERPRDIRYVFWKDNLWMEVNHSLGRIEKFYASTLAALKKLDYMLLREVWADWYALYPTHADQLIALTLERRDMLLREANMSRKISKN